MEKTGPRKVQAQLQPFANLSTGKCRPSCPGLFSRSGDRALGPDNGKESRELQWDKEASSQPLFFYAHPTTANCSRGLDSISCKGATGADELITSKKRTCSLWLLVTVWQKSCRNPCVKGGKQQLKAVTRRHQSMSSSNSKSPLSSAIKFQGRELHPNTIKEIKDIKYFTIQ